MSTAITYLIIVKAYDDMDVSVHSAILEEDAELFDLVKSLGVQVGTWRGERHLLIPLQAPLTSEQVQALTKMKEIEWFTDFYVKEIEP